jgi:hypothetical protein
MFAIFLFRFDQVGMPFPAFRQGLKPAFICATCGTTKEEKERKPSNQCPSRAKALRFYWVYAGDKSPASLRIVFFRSL